MLVYCIQTAEDIVVLFCYPGSTITLVSSGYPMLPNSKGNPLSWSIKYTWMGVKISVIFFG